MTDKPGEDFEGSEATKHFRALLGVKEGMCAKMQEYKILATGRARAESTNILGLVFFFFFVNFFLFKGFSHFTYQPQFSIPPLLPLPLTIPPTGLPSYSSEWIRFPMGSQQGSGLSR